MSFLPSFGSDGLDIDWLGNNQALPAFLIALFIVVVTIAGKTMKTVVEDFMKARPVLALACLLAGILLYLNLLWLPPLLCTAAVIGLRTVPLLRGWQTRWSFAFALAVYLIGYPLQSSADYLVHRLTWGGGPGLILLPHPNNPMLSATGSNQMKDAFSLYLELRRGLTNSFQSVDDVLYIVPDKDPDEKAFGATYATATLRPERVERLSRWLALTGQSLDIIIETDFVDAIVCDMRRWRVTIRLKIWRKNTWRPWSTGRIDPDTGWLLSTHSDMQALDEKNERVALGLLAAYELGQYFDSGQSVPLDHAHAVRLRVNLIDRFEEVIWRIHDSYPLPTMLHQEMVQLDRTDPAKVDATLKDIVAFFQTILPSGKSTNCTTLADREQSTAISALGRQ